MKILVLRIGQTKFDYRTLFHGRRILRTASTYTAGEVQLPPQRARAWRSCRTVSSLTTCEHFSGPDFVFILSLTVHLQGTEEGQCTLLVSTQNTQDTRIGLLTFYVTGQLSMSLPSTISVLCNRTVRTKR